MEWSAEEINEGEVVCGNQRLAARGEDEGEGSRSWHCRERVGAVDGGDLKVGRAMMIQRGRAALDLIR